MEYGGTCIVSVGRTEHEVIKSFNSNIDILKQPKHSHHAGEDMFDREVDFLLHMKTTGVPHVSDIRHYDKQNRLIYMKRYAGDMKQCMGHLSSLDILQVFLDVAVALSTLHEQGVCHNDVGLRNILFINEDSRTRGILCDFGDAVYVKKTRDNVMNRYSKEALVRDYKRFYDAFVCASGVCLQRTYDWVDIIYDIGIMVMEEGA